jgi:RNA polymerase sigma-70 factor (ECF subfamily)
MTDDAFVTHRGLLFTVAYEVLGSRADAEDVVQETWLRWADVDRAEVRAPRAYLVRIVTRQALNRLRTLSRRREEYVGQWLPEPLLTVPDAAQDVELAESVSIAMLTVLETLGPVERAVFVLREVFDVPYDEIAEAVGKSAAAVRQIAHRAREHVAARRPRMSVSRAEQQTAVERFRAALTTGDLQGLLDVLAPDVVLVADGGGVVPAAIRPVSGAKTVARLLSGFSAHAPGARVGTTWLNGAPALRIDPAGEFDTAISLTVEGGRITRIYAIRNPHKLSRLDEPALSFAVAGPRQRLAPSPRSERDRGGSERSCDGRGPGAPHKPRHSVAPPWMRARTPRLEGLSVLVRGGRVRAGRRDAPIQRQAVALSGSLSPASLGAGRMGRRCSTPHCERGAPRSRGPDALTGCGRAAAPRGCGAA